jgi:peptidase M15-like protein
MGFELDLNSGYRDPGHNLDVGGVPDSEHTYDPAQGADVLCLRSVTRFRMLKELFSMGVRRIGIGQTFLHVGIAADKPQEVAWHYYQTAKPSSTEV